MGRIIGGLTGAVAPTVTYDGAGADIDAADCVFVAFSGAADGVCGVESLVPAFVVAGAAAAEEVDIATSRIQSFKVICTLTRARFNTSDEGQGTRRAWTEKRDAVSIASGNRGLLHHTNESD